MKNKKYFKNLTLISFIVLFANFGFLYLFSHAACTPGTFYKSSCTATNNGASAGNCNCPISGTTVPCHCNGTANQATANSGQICPNPSCSGSCTFVGNGNSCTSTPVPCSAGTACSNYYHSTTGILLQRCCPTPTPTPICNPGDKKCFSTTQIQTCSASSTWGSPMYCLGTTTCSGASPNATCAPPTPTPACTPPSTCPTPCKQWNTTTCTCSNNDGATCTVGTVTGSCTAGVCVTPTPCAGCGIFNDLNNTLKCANAGVDGQLLKCDTSQPGCPYVPSGTSCATGKICNGDPSSTCTAGSPAGTDCPGGNPGIRCVLACGNGALDTGVGEICDGTANCALPRICNSTCSACACPTGQHQCPTTGAALVCCDNLTQTDCNESACGPVAPPPPAVCGDNIINGAEVCDGLALGSCTACNSTCQCSTAPPTCLVLDQGCGDGLNDFVCGILTGCCTGLTCKFDALNANCKCASNTPMFRTTTTDTEFLEEQNQIDSPDKKCGECKPPDCNGKCENPEKECVTKFSKKQKKDICKCRKKDASDEDIDSDDEN